MTNQQITEKERFLNNLITKLKNDVFENKSSWNSFSTKCKVENLAQKTLDVIKNEVLTYKYNPSIEDYDEEKRKHVTFTKYGKRDYYYIYKAEEGLERIITILNKDIKNQIVVPDNGHVDFVIIDKNGNTSFVELKRWSNNSDNPMYAVLESLKNYFEYKAMINDEIPEKNIKEGKDFETLKKQYKENGIKKVKELIVLAPIEYYQNFTKASNSDKKSKWIAFFKYVEELNKLLKNEIKISVKYLNIPYGDSENSKNLKKGEWLYIMKNDFDPIVKKLKNKKINLGSNKYKRQFDDIKNELLSTKWLNQDLDISILF